MSLTIYCFQKRKIFGQNGGLSKLCPLEVLRPKGQHETPALWRISSRPPGSPEGESGDLPAMSGRVTFPALRLIPRVTLLIDHTGFPSSPTDLPDFRTCGLWRSRLGSYKYLNSQCPWSERVIQSITHVYFCRRTKPCRNEPVARKQTLSTNLFGHQQK